MIRPDDDFDRLAAALRHAPAPSPEALTLALDQALAAYDAMPTAPPAPVVAPATTPGWLQRLWSGLQRPGGMAGAALAAGLAVVTVGPALRDPVPDLPPPAAAPPITPQAEPPVQALRKAAPSAAAAPEADGLATGMSADMAAPGMAEADMAAADPWQALATALKEGAAPDPAQVNAADLALARIAPPPVETLLLPSPFAAMPVLALRPPGSSEAAAAIGRSGWTLHPQSEGQPDPRPTLRFIGGAAGVALALQGIGYPLAPALAFAEAAARPEDAADLALLRRWAALGK